MKGLVFLTDNNSEELNRIKDLSEKFHRKIYIYGYTTDISFFAKSLTDFLFIRLEDILLPTNIKVILENNEDDFFVIKRVRFHDVMNRNIETLQSLKGYKLVVDDHPYLGKGDIAWSYFLWSFFDRNVLGYPHFYAFQTALNKISPNYSEIALKVLSRTETTIHSIFSEESIITERVVLNSEVKEKYLILKKELFEKWGSAGQIIGDLKRFINAQYPQLKQGFDLIRFSRIHDQYIKGCRRLILSDVKVDGYLEGKFWAYIRNINIFMEVLWKKHN